MSSSTSDLDLRDLVGWQPTRKHVFQVLKDSPVLGFVCTDQDVVLWPVLYAPFCELSNSVLAADMPPCAWQTTKKRTAIVYFELIHNVYRSILHNHLLLCKSVSVPLIFSFNNITDVIKIYTGFIVASFLSPLFCVTHYHELLLLTKQNRTLSTYFSSLMVWCLLFCSTA